MDGGCQSERKRSKTAFACCFACLREKWKERKKNFELLSHFSVKQTKDKEVKLTFHMLRGAGKFCFLAEFRLD